MQNNVTPNNVTPLHETFYFWNNQPESFLDVMIVVLDFTIQLLISL